MAGKIQFQVSGTMTKAEPFTVTPRHIPTPGPAFEAGYRVKSKAVGGSQGSHPAGLVSLGEHFVHLCDSGPLDVVRE